MDVGILRGWAAPVILGIALTWGCSSRGHELSLVSYGPAADQYLIADYYRREAARFRQRAEELDARIEMYTRMFGEESDWVSGTRLLAESYRHAAEERERLAKEHMESLRHPQFPR